VPVSQILQTRQWLADNGRADVPVIVWGADRNEDTLTGYAEAGVEEVALSLPTLNASAMRRDLDELAQLVESVSLS